MQNLELAKKLYDTYNEAVGGVAFNGDKLPTSEDFFNDDTKKKQIDGWLAVASVAFKEIVGPNLVVFGSVRKTADLTYEEALDYLKEGRAVKLPEWGGIWFPVRDKIFVFTKEGEILDTPDHETYGVRNDWTAEVPVEIIIAFVKALRVKIDVVMSYIKNDISQSREASLAYTAAQRGFMYLGRHLGALGAEYPYPKSFDHTSPVIEKATDKSDETSSYLDFIKGLSDETAKVKALRQAVLNIIGFVEFSGSFISQKAGMCYYGTAIESLTDSTLWLGQQLGNIREKIEAQATEQSGN